MHILCRTVMTLLFASSLAGCDPTDYVKPGLGEAEQQADKDACRKQVEGVAIMQPELAKHRYILCLRDRGYTGIR